MRTLEHAAQQQHKRWQKIADACGMQQEKNTQSLNYGDMADVQLQLMRNCAAPECFKAIDGIQHIDPT